MISGASFNIFESVNLVQALNYFKVVLKVLDETKKVKIKERIKLYLLEFNAYSKAIKKLENYCDGSEKKLGVTVEKKEKLNIKYALLKENLKHINEMKEKLIGESQVEDADLGDFFEDFLNINNKFDDIRENLRELKIESNHLKSCVEISDEVIDNLGENFQITFERLHDAQKNFPVLYDDAEAELGIHIFSPPP